MGGLLHSDGVSPDDRRKVERNRWDEKGFAAGGCACREGMSPTARGIVMLCGSVCSRGSIAGSAGCGEVNQSRQDSHTKVCSNDIVIVCLLPCREPPDAGLMCECLWSDPAPEQGRQVRRPGQARKLGHCTIILQLAIMMAPSVSGLSIIMKTRRNPYSPVCAPATNPLCTYHKMTDGFVRYVLCRRASVVLGCSLVLTSPRSSWTRTDSNWSCAATR